MSVNHDVESCEICADTWRWVTRAHRSLVAAARKGHAREGRGVLRCVATRRPSTRPAQWIALNAIVECPATASLLRMLRTYDPATQFVVLAKLEGEGHCVQATVFFDQAVQTSEAVH